MSQMTKQALANSLKSLLQKKTLNKITIKDIVDDCGVNVYHSVNRVQLEDYLKSWLKPILSSIVNEVAQSMEISQENREFVTDVYVLMMVGFFMEWMEYDMPKDKLGKLDKLFYCMDGSIAYTLGKFEETK